MAITSDGTLSVKALKASIEKLCDAVEKLRGQVQQSPGQTAALEPGRQVLTRAGVGRSKSADLSLRRARKALEAEMIKQALSATGGNRTHAARLLEICQRALLYKIKEYGIRD